MDPVNVEVNCVCGNCLEQDDVEMIFPEVDSPIVENSGEVAEISYTVSSNICFSQLPINLLKCICRVYFVSSGDNNTWFLSPYELVI